MNAATEVRTGSQLQHPSRRGRVSLATAVAIVLMAVGVMAWCWWTHPKAFADLGDSFSADPLPLADAALATTVIFPKVSGSDEALTIHRLEATFATNTAEADATFWICHMTAGEDPIGAVHDPGQACSEYQEFKPPMRFQHGIAPDSDYLFVTLTPTRPGVTNLESVAVGYRRSGDHLYQRGTQKIHVDRKITVR